MWREKTDKRIVAAGIILVGLFVGYGAWQDMHPPPRTVQIANFTPYYMVTSDEELEALKPMKDASTIIWVGDIESTEDGETVFTPSPVHPVSLAQQEVILLYRVKNPLPRQLSPAFEAFGKGLKPWYETGTLINDIYVEYQPENPDIQRLGVLSNGLRGFFQHQYWIDLEFRRSAESLEPEQKRDLGNLLKSARLMVYKGEDVMRETDDLPATIIRLSSEGVPFALRLPRKPEVEGLAAKLGDKGDNLGGFVIDNISAAEPEKKEETP